MFERTPHPKKKRGKMFNAKPVGALDALQAQQEQELAQILKQHRRQLLEAQAQQQAQQQRVTDDDIVVPRRPGAPKKAKPKISEEEEEEQVKPVKRGRKPQAKSPEPMSEDEAVPVKTKAKKGRNAKSPKPMSSGEEQEVEPTPVPAKLKPAAAKKGRNVKSPQPMSSGEEEEEVEPVKTKPPASKKGKAQPKAPQPVVEDTAMSSEGEEEQETFASQPRTAEKLGGKPKQPLNAFMMFRMDAAPKIKQKTPKMPLQEMNQQISLEWQNMQPHIKDTYIRKAKEAQLAYAEAKRNYGRQLYCCAGLTMVFPPGGKKHKAELVAQESERLGNEWSAKSVEDQEKWLKNEKRRQKKFEKLAL